jgi:hypothetical protein
MFKPKKPFPRSLRPLTGVVRGMGIWITLAGLEYYTSAPSSFGSPSEVFKPR